MIFFMIYSLTIRNDQFKIHNPLCPKNSSQDSKRIHKILIELKIVPKVI